MTIEEYLTDVKRIYYQLSVIVKGRQLLTFGRAHRLTDIRDSQGKLGELRFSTLLLPADTEVDRIGTDHAAVEYGGAHLVIWPKREAGNDVQ